MTGRIITWTSITALAISSWMVNDYRVNTLPEGGEIVTVVGIHEDTYYRVTGHDDGSPPPADYPAFAEVMVKDADGHTYVLELNGLDFARSIQVGDELIGIRSAKGGIANLERRK